ncbi:replication domain protein [Burkholderia cepacia]|nr:replication domain protein [Burkholderia cepacia]MDW9248893.1 replication domain protein [Burkholderia cepacia]
MVSMSFWTHFTADAILPENFSSDPTYGHDEARQENRCGCGECQFSRIA